MTGKSWERCFPLKVRTIDCQLNFEMEMRELFNLMLRGTAPLDRKKKGVFGLSWTHSVGRQPIAWKGFLSRSWPPSFGPVLSKEILPKKKRMRARKRRPPIRVFQRASSNPSCLDHEQERSKLEF